MLSVRSYQSPTDRTLLRARVRLHSTGRVQRTTYICTINPESQKTRVTQSKLVKWRAISTGDGPPFNQHLMISPTNLSAGGVLVFIPRTSSVLEGVLLHNDTFCSQVGFASHNGHAVIVQPVQRSIGRASTCAVFCTHIHIYNI